MSGPNQNIINETPPKISSIKPRRFSRLLQTTISPIQQPIPKNSTPHTTIHINPPLSPNSTEMLSPKKIIPILPPPMNRNNIPILPTPMNKNNISILPTRTIPILPTRTIPTIPTRTIPTRTIPTPIHRNNISILQTRTIPSPIRTIPSTIRTIPSQLRTIPSPTRNIQKVIINVKEQKLEQKLENKGIPYIGINMFMQLYGGNEFLGRGGFGSVYSSRNPKFVVKHIPSICKFLKELNNYTSISHPCILKPVAWTFSSKGSPAGENVGMIAMPRGIDLRTAYKEGKISIEEIVSDTLSAIAFMNSRGIGYCDNKPANMIYLDGKAQIIDMDNARKGKLTPDGQYYVTGVAYTKEFKDAEYFPEQFNNISADTYALARTYYALANDLLYPEIDKLYNFTTNIPHLNWFISRAQLFQDTRPSIHYLLANAPPELIVRRYDGTIFKEQKINIDPNCGNVQEILMKYILKNASGNLNSEGLFLALHLAHRSLKKIFPNYYKDPIDKLYPFADACLEIVKCVTLNEEEIIYNPMIIEILKVTNGIISCLTYWDYASSKEDLVDLLHDTINCNYDPERIREINNNLNKNIEVSELRELYNKKYQIYNMWEKIPTVAESKIHPINFIKTTTINEFLAIFKSNYNPDSQFMIGLTMHNRYILPLLPRTEAFEIFDILYDKRSHTHDVLNIICNFDWNTYDPEILIQLPSIHPFISTDIDIIEFFNF